MNFNNLPTAFLPGLCTAVLVVLAFAGAIVIGLADPNGTNAGLANVQNGLTAFGCTGGGLLASGLFIWFLNSVD